MAGVKVSILIPVFNAETYLKQSLESVLNQSFTNIEIIAVNDGSTDKSASLLEDYCSRHDNFFLIHQENKGQSAAFNTALSHATGDYIKFFDADDVMNQEHIELQLERIKGKRDSLASCEWGRFYNNNPRSTIFNPEPVWKDMEPFSWIKTALSQETDMMGAWLWLIPRPLLEKAGEWNEQLNLNNDFEFSIRLLLLAKKVCFAKGAKLFYRSGTRDSLSTSISRQNILAAIESTNMGCNHLMQVENSPMIRNLCANRYQDWIYRVYPKFPDLTKKLKRKVKELGGSDKTIKGGRIFLLLKRMLGWKLARRIQLLTYKLGYLPKHPHLE